MGLQFFDQYMYLHFAVGIVIYYWGISLKNWIIVHSLFELLENTTFGIYFINTYLKFWPGKKPNPDTIINILGDTLGAILGWLSARSLDKLGEKKGWYEVHLKNNIKY